MHWIKVSLFSLPGLPIFLSESVARLLGLEVGISQVALLFVRL